MGYMHINNLYKNTDIMMFKECYALEKIHGTSAHISFKFEEKDIRFVPGGESYEKFIALFDKEAMLKTFLEKFTSDIVIFGEAYGGKQQGMRETYGPDLKFIAFDVKVEDKWTNVPNAHSIAGVFGIEFVDYVQIPTTLEAINAERDRDSVQAIRNGMGEGHKREGVVLRPLVEVTLNNGARVMCKHKRDEFIETRTPREVDPAKLQVLTESREIADEWVTPMRLEHVLDKLPQDIGMENTVDVIKAMIEDVYREAEGEIVQSKEVSSAIGKRTAQLFKERLKSKLNNL